MQSHATPSADAARRQRPKTLTVFAAAFAAGAVLAYGVNRVVDVHVVQVEPQVESEPIFVALRSLPQGSPVTVWDVALKDWPKAMLPTTALRADASLEGMVLRHPIREGQPLLAVQLARDVPAPTTAIAAVPAATPPAPRGATPSRPADDAAAGPASTTQTAGPVGERFVPATPAEPAAAADVATSSTTGAETARDTAADAPVAIPTPPVEPMPVVEPAPVVTATPPETIAAVPSAAAATMPSTAAAPRSTDVDVPVAGPAAVASRPVAEPEPTPAPLPVPLAQPAPLPVPQLADVTTVAAAPLAAPVPALPSTDISRSLAELGRLHQPAVAVASPERPESVLDRTTEAEPPAAMPSAPRLHLVVPERIALAVDASFTDRPTAQPEAGERTNREPQPQAAAAQDGSGARRQPATQQQARQQPAAARKPAQQQPRQQPATRPQASPSRGLNAWLPKFMGESRQR